MPIPQRLLTLCLLIALPALATPRLEDGYDAFEQGDATRAVAIWTELAEAGNQTAQLNLGQLYRTGRGVPQDDALAVKWYVEAGRNGSKMARYTLKLMQQEGRASEEDVARAFNGLAPPTTEVAAQPSREAEAGTDNKEPSTREWLSRLPQDGYVVQLLGSSRPDRLQQYKTREFTDASPQPRVVHTYRQGQNWYLLLMGPYPSAAAAQAAIAALPAHLQESKPWVRPIAGLPLPQASP